jgi:hypothetical protein
VTKIGELVAPRIRYAHLWVPGAMRTRMRRTLESPPSDLWVLIADHYEPLWQGASDATARRRVEDWRRRWPEIAERHADSSGRRPVYTFFYPQEEYHPHLLDPIAEMARAGIADVEVHIHHDGDGSALFVEKMQGFLEALHGRHGLLRRRDGKLAFGFIHGNWALDNARPDGRWCGLDNELTLLRELGCYADFTLPAADSPCQAGPVNVIYRATDDPHRPRSHAKGEAVRPGVEANGDLLLIPGPLGLDLRSRGPWRPRIEAGELAGYYPPTAQRVKLWLRLAPRIGPHAFLKLFGHGAQERNSGPLLASGLDELFELLDAECRARGIRLHYVTAWEMYRAVEALRTGSDPVATASPKAEH